MVYRVYVEKKSSEASEARALLSEVRTFLGIDGLEKVRILNRYDVEDVEPELRMAAEKGLINGGVVPAPVSPTTMQAFQMYYRQSADKLNLVNTVMLESTENAYRATVSDIVNRMQRTQRILNDATGEVISGAESFNQSLRLATAKMVENGITGFIDHGGHRWAPETYVAMDMRTTYHNASRAAFWERNQDYTNDLYLVSQHPGARPLCYPWQCKVISRANNRRWEEDGSGQPVQVWPQNETSYGEPAGLFGINCGHHPMAFIPGVTKVPEVRQNEEQNAKQYAESQKQRALEREFRRARLGLDVAKAQGADKEEIKAAKQKIADVDARLNAFCEETGRKRRKEREYAPVDAKWPDPETYSAAESSTGTRDAMREWFKGGGAQGAALTGGGGDGTIATEQNDWSTASFQTEAKFRRHIDRHMADFGYTTKEEYLEGARALLNAKVSADVEGFTGRDGFVFRYDVNNNALAIGHPGGSISTFFKPVEGRVYWNEQIEKHKP